MNSPMTLGSLQDRRHHGLVANQNSKQRMTREGRIIRNEWGHVWPDLSVTETEPTVENIFLEAAQDKSATAAAIPPNFDVPPRRGTRKDRAENNAQKSRRVFVTLTQNSHLDDLLVGLYHDWFVYGGVCALAWKDWNDPTGRPFIEQVEPRHFYPLAWKPGGQLAEGMVIRRRRYADLILEYGVNNPALGDIAGGHIEEWYEEIWWATETHWAIAVGHESGVSSGDFNYRRPNETGYNNMAVAWLRAPSSHRLNGCPIVAKKAFSADREIHGMLDGMLPPLKMAHGMNIEAWTNVKRNMHAPPLMQNIENPEDFGPDAFMYGIKGADDAVIAYPRPPVDFAAFQQVAEQLRSARNVVHFPQQRGGEPGASIASGEAVTQLQGGFNAIQAWAQNDMAFFLTSCFGRLASLDEQWTRGEVEIDGFDAGEAFTDKYTPSEFWQGDYRVHVSFHALGVDSHANLLNMGAAHRLGWLPSREAMLRSGLVANPLAAERDNSLETGVKTWEQLIVPALVQSGQIEPWLEYIDLIDGDKETPRSAMVKVLKEQTQQAAEQPAAAPPPQVSPELLALTQGGGGGPPPQGGPPA